MSIEIYCQYSRLNKNVNCFILQHICNEEKMAEWLSFDKFEATIMEALESLNDLVDESDPDVNIPNIVHAFQTAERIRAIHPHHDWFHLVGLIHDLGKVSKQYLNVHLNY